MDHWDPLFGDGEGRGFVVVVVVVVGWSLLVVLAGERRGIAKRRERSSLGLWLLALSFVPWFLSHRCLNCIVLYCTVFTSLGRGEGNNLENTAFLFCKELKY